MKTKKGLQRWASELSLEERLKLQKFMLQLYSMELNDGKNRRTKI